METISEFHSEFTKEHLLGKAGMYPIRNQCVLYVWYDNEFGYTVQLMGLAKEMVGLTYKRYPNYQKTI